MLYRQLSIIWPQTLVAGWLSVLLQSWLKQAAVLWRTDEQDPGLPKPCPPNLLCWNGVQVNPVPKCVAIAYDECSVGFSSGKSRGCRLFNTDWFCFSEGGRELREQEEMRETVMRRVPRQSRDKSPWDRELIMCVKKNAAEGKLFAPVSHVIKGTEFSAVFPWGLHPKGYAAFMPATAQRLKFYKTNSTGRSTWTRGGKNTNTCLNFTSSLYYSCLFCSK